MVLQGRIKFRLVVETCTRVSTHHTGFWSPRCHTAR